MQVITDGWYTAYNVKERIWAIDDHGQDNFYAVLGNERALMIDNGFGAGDLGAFMKKLSPLPWIAANTHGDIDHALGNNFFDEVYIGEDDYYMLGDDDVEAKRDLIRDDPRMFKIRKMDFKQLGGCHGRIKTHFLQEGQVFDLGGRKVTAHLIPGHSKGSACFIDDYERVLFMGDMYVPLQEWNEMWLQLDRCTSLRVCSESMRRVCGLRGAYDTVMSGHGSNYAMEADRIEEVAAAMEDIVLGKRSGVVFPNPYGVDSQPCVYRCKRAGFLYDPDKVY